MESINYVMRLTGSLMVLMSLGTGFRCVQIAIQALNDGEDLPNILKKVKRKIYALIAFACSGSLISIIQNYY